MTEDSAACPFCERIAANEYVGCGRDTVMFEPLNPVTPGHMLFVPRKHVLGADHQPWVTALVMEEASKYAGHQEEDFNLITSCGPRATQTINHLHIHYVPRRPDDGLTLPWTGQQPLTEPVMAKKWEFFDV